MRNPLRREDPPLRKEAVERAREARRTIRRERAYECSGCGFERRTWLALHSCPSCGSGVAETAAAHAAAG